MPSGSDRERGRGGAGQETTRADGSKFDLQAEVLPPTKAEDFQKTLPESAHEPRPPKDIAGLQRALDADPRATSEQIVASRDPGYAPPLAAILQAETIVRDAAVRGLARIAFLRDAAAWAAPKISDAEFHRTCELVATSDPDSLRQALHANTSLVDSLVHVALFTPLNVVSIFESALEKTRVVSLHGACAKAWISAEPQQISEAMSTALDSAAALIGHPASSDALTVIESLMKLRPLAVLPYLRPVLAKTAGGPQRDALLEAVDRLIVGRFRVPGGTPDEARRLTRSLFGHLLENDTLEKSLREQVAEIVRARTRVGILGEDFDSVIKELAQASGAAEERIASGLWGTDLTSPNLAERGQVPLDGADWVIAHLHGDEGLPWTWRVYDHILRFSPKIEQRIEAATRLGAYGPTSTLEPLPPQVQEVRNLLEQMLRTAEDAALRNAAQAALDLHRKRAEEAVPETRLILCPPAREFPTAISTTWSVPCVELPRLPIHTNLTLSLPLSQISPVARMDASQGAPLDPTADRPVDLDLSSHQITLNSGRDGFSTAQSNTAGTVVPTDRVDLTTASFTTIDPAVLRTRTLLVSEPEEDLSRLDLFEHGKQVLKRVQQRIHHWTHTTIHDAQRYLDRLKETDFAGYSVAQKREVADTVKRLAKIPGLTLLCREANSKAWKTVTNVRCNVSNERSKGTFRVSSGSEVITTATPRSHFPELRAVAQGENESTRADGNPEI